MRCYMITLFHHVQSGFRPKDSTELEDVLLN